MVDTIEPYVKTGNGKPSPLSMCSEYVPAANKTLRGFGYILNGHLYVPTAQARRRPHTAAGGRRKWWENGGRS